MHMHRPITVNVVCVYRVCVLDSCTYGVRVFYLPDWTANAARQINFRNYTFAEFNMVACRITDARNIAANNHHLHNRSTGSISSGQVPLKKWVCPSDCASELFDSKFCPPNCQTLSESVSESRTVSVSVTLSSICLTHFTLIGNRHARSTDLLSLHSNTEHYRDYESVFIVPGPSCHNQNRKQAFLKLKQSFLPQFS